MDVAQLIVTAMVPIAVLAVGFVTNRSLTRYESRQAANQKLIEKRIQIYDEMAEDLNTVYCFLVKVGHYRDEGPDRLIRLKRTLDQCAHTNRPFFDAEHHQRYQEFMDVCFRTHTGPGSHAKLRADPDDYRAEYADGWDDDWVDSFVADPGDRRTGEMVRQRHDELMDSFAGQMGTQQ